MDAGREVIPLGRRCLSGQPAFAQRASCGRAEPAAGQARRRLRVTLGAPDVTCQAARVQHDALPLAGTAEIADRMGVTTAAIHMWRSRHHDFPQPVAKLRAGSVYWWPDVEAWVSRTGRYGPSLGLGVLDDEQWARIEPLLPLSDRRGRARRDHRQVVEGMVFRHRTGLRWRDMPARFGPWGTIFRRYNRYQEDGTWDGILQVLESDTVDQP